MNRPSTLRVAVVTTVLAGAALAGPVPPAVAAVPDVRAAGTPAVGAGPGRQDGNPVPAPHRATRRDAHQRDATANTLAEGIATRAARAPVPRWKSAAPTGGREPADQGAGLAPRSAPAGPAKILGSGPPVAGINGTSCTFGTIEEAIELSPAGSTIYIAPGVHPAAQEDVDYNIGKTLDLVQGTANCQPTTGGAATNVVLQRHPGSSLDAVVEVMSGVAVRLERITVEGGNSAEGTLHVRDNGIAVLDGAIVRDGVNPSSTVGGGGVQVIGPGAQLYSVNNSQIENNRAVLGGGIYVDDGTVTIDGFDNVEFNAAGANGGGIHATNRATVVLAGNADVTSNSATNRGGGVYLTGGSTLSVSEGNTEIGWPGQSNTAYMGGGIFAEGGSTVTLGHGTQSGSVSSNRATYGGGVYALGAGTTVRVSGYGSVESNVASANGGGILATQGALADLDNGASVSWNSAGGLAGGVMVFAPASLDVDGGPGGGTRVHLSGNSATTDGGGIWASGAATLDDVVVRDNTAANGGGLYLTDSGRVSITENNGCTPSWLEKESYCNEFRANTAGTAGGAIFAAGGDVTAVQTAFIGNRAGNAAVLLANGDAVVGLRASLAVSNTDVNLYDEALVTGRHTSSITLVGMTFARHTEAFLDTDETATATVSRVLTTTGTLTLAGMPAGGCNISAVGATLPGLLVTPVLFRSTIRTDHLPAAGSPALDRCPLSGGHHTDLDGTRVVDLAPAGIDDHDVGAFEATS
ncbi:hypothetical protein ACPFP2_22420 [Micromonospora citrea]|uniref:hypothetical protein n=1 Tax=Micromonospora citrea TaxID=47855 RepID=UPI003C4FA502